VKKHIQQLERWGKDDETHQEIIADMKDSHRWTRNIPHPSTLKHYNANKSTFPSLTDLFDDTDRVDEADL
jgi:hypothetical protein